MDITITPSLLRGTINAVSSKSQAHRALIAAALANEKTVINLNSFSDDINATIRCLTALGANFKTDEATILSEPIKQPNSALLDCGESGSTLRFLLPVACALCDSAEFTGHGRLAKRPLSPLREEMEQKGCVFSESENFPLRIKGKLKSGVFRLAGNISSQFISGLLFALPLLDGDSEIAVTSSIESEAYINMTIDTLNAFGISITRSGNSYFVKGNQQYVSPRKINIEGDWSNSAFWLCSGALGNKVSVKNLSASSVQGDKAVLDILKNMGADILYTENTVTVLPPEKGLTATEIDASQIPDLIPVLSVTSAFAKGDTVIKNAERLRLKESDRLIATAKLITDMGGKVTQTDSSLIIHGSGKLQGKTVDSFQDHRIAMSAAISATALKNNITITNAQAVNKSYPDFFKDYKSLGGNFYVIDNRR